MKYFLALLLLFSFPLVAEERIELICDGTYTMITERNGKEIIQEELTIIIDETAMLVGNIKYDNSGYKKYEYSSDDFQLTEFNKFEIKENEFSFSHTQYLDGRTILTSTGQLNRYTGKFSSRMYAKEKPSLDSRYEGICKKTKRAF